MKALTLWQPYATLVAGSIKTIETRSWGTPYRGQLAIHAARKFDEDVVDDIKEAQANLKKLWGLPIRLRPECQQALYATAWRDTLGCIVAIVDLIDCQPMLEAPDGENALFGNFGPGRWGWVFDVATIEPLPEPLPCRGQRMLWNVPSDVLAKMEPGLVTRAGA